MSEPIQRRPCGPEEDATATANTQTPAKQLDTAPETPALAPEPAKDTENAPNQDFKALTDHALHFLATASNETLAACLLGLGASTYFVLGRVGLLLMGVVGGVVLHATWEGHAHRNVADNAPGSSKREQGVEVLRRVLDWRETVSQGQEKGGDDHSGTDVKLYAGQDLDYSDFRPETAAALTELTDAIIRDYVKWWYSPLLPSEDSFPATCRRTLAAFMISVSSHLSRKRPADNLVDFVTRSSSFIIIFFQELSAALAASPNASTPEAVETYLQLKSDSTLGNILDRKYQEKQFDTAADDILQSYLDPKTYNCKPAQVFLKEMLSKVVFEKIVVSCSKPEWINGWIVFLLEDGEPELMQAIDAGVEANPSQLQTMKNAMEKQVENVENASPEQKIHKRVVSKAQEAMDDAMREAQRLSLMIAEDNARKLKEHFRHESNSGPLDDRSESTTQGIVTPTSSQSETLGDSDAGDVSTSDLSARAPPKQARSQSPIKAPEEPPKQEVRRKFTSFDQIIPMQSPTALQENPPPPLTLYNCNISIFDDSTPGEKGIIKNRPVADYLIQVEPTSNHYSGWMTVRKYSDLETLHEVLRRIAPITGTTGFTEAHGTLPTWKGHTKASLRGELERYLNDAVKFKPLAESEALKRFLEKEAQMNKLPGSKGGFPGLGWPGQSFENMGKGMIEVLTKAPKEVAGGGKALFGGVAGVLGSVTTPGRRNRDSVSSGAGNPSRRYQTIPSEDPKTPITNRHGRAESTVSELPTHIRTESTISAITKPTSTDSIRNPNSPIVDQQPQREAPMDRRPSTNPDGDGKRSGHSSVYGASRSNSRAPSARESMEHSQTIAMGGDMILNLPPIPSDIPDDYTISPTTYQPRHHLSRSSTTSLPLAAFDPVPPLPRRPSAISLSQVASANNGTKKSIEKKRTYAPLSEQETTVLIELFFAVTNALYTLSSAWQIRRSLLSAAKSFLLRPGNPQLSSIQNLLQSTVLDAHSSDESIAYHIRKIRENAVPTAEEVMGWPKELSDEEKEALRLKARRLLVERGMPTALTSVMGQVASGEAVGRVFDVLQGEGEVARGVVFGLVVQGLRAVTQ